MNKNSKKVWFETDWQVDGDLFCPRISASSISASCESNSDNGFLLKFGVPYWLP